MKKRKVYEVEEIFRDHIVKIVKNLLVHDPNYDTNYYTSDYRGNSQLIKDIKDKAEYILEEIANTEHLILDNGVKELQEQVKEMTTKLECNQLLRYDKTKPDQVNCISKGVAKCEGCKGYCPKIYKPSYTS